MRARADLWRLGVVVVVVAGALLFSREVGNDFLWGHDGGNGAPYWNGALNSVRFHTLIHAKGYYGLAPPTAADNYTHHPPLLHLDLVLARLLFGPAEWAGRLVPLAYSIALVVLLQRCASRLWGRELALAAAALFVLTPLHLVFASMINHEQGAMFWTLWSTYVATRYYQHGGQRRLRAAVLTGTLALQFAWAAYFVLATFAAFVSVAAWIAPRAGIVGARARRLAFGLVGTLALNALAFFAMVALGKGSLSDMIVSFGHRTGEVDSYLDVIVRRATDLYGPILLGLAVAGGVRLVRRVRDGRLRPRDLIAPSFVLGQLGLSIVFRNAGRIHSFWTYFGGIGCAILAADALVAVSAALRRRGWSARGTVVAVGAIVVAQGAYAMNRFDWGLATGHAAYKVPFDDQYEEVQVAKWLRGTFGRDVTYVLHDSFAAREEVYFYLDAPHVVQRGAAAIPPCRTRACVVVADVRRERDGDRLANLAELAARHPTVLFAGHIVAIEVSRVAAAPLALTLAPGEAGLFHSWFVNGRHPSQSWVPGPDAQALITSVLPEAEPTTFEAESATTGARAFQPCPRGFLVTGFEMQRRGDDIVAVRTTCSRAGEERQTSWIGTPTRQRGIESRCAHDETAIGLTMASANAIGSAQLLCGHADRARIPELLTSGGYVLACPEGLAVTAVRARLDPALVGLGIGCAPP